MQNILEFVAHLPPFKVFKLRLAVILKDMLKHQLCEPSGEISG